MGNAEYMGIQRKNQKARVRENQRKKNLKKNLMMMIKRRNQRAKARVNQRKKNLKKNLMMMIKRKKARARKEDQKNPKRKNLLVDLCYCSRKIDQLLKRN